MIRHPELEWETDAGCRGGDYLRFFPGTTKPDDPAARAAIDVCERCPVDLECLEHALTYRPVEDFGVWGGTLEGERIKIRTLIDGGLTAEEARAVVVRGRKARS